MSFQMEDGTYPSLAALRRIFSTRHRACRDLIDRGAANFGEPWVAEFNELLARLFPEPSSLERAARGYVGFALASMRLQARFEVEGEYATKTYAEAAREVYFNAEHMEAEYLPGLLLSHYLWPHHYRQLQFFQTTFIEPLRRAGGTQFAEVAVGTGLYSRLVLQALPQVQGLGYDISPSSQVFARHHVGAFGFGERYDVVLRDVTETAQPEVAWLICVEVLEHLEDPVAFLRALRHMLPASGRAFITAALNAAHPDHIYLYRTPEEVWRHLEQAGFVLEQYLAAAAYPPPRPHAPVPLAAAFLVSA